MNCGSLDDLVAVVEPVRATEYAKDEEDFPREWMVVAVIVAFEYASGGSVARRSARAEVHESAHMLVHSVGFLEDVDLVCFCWANRHRETSCSPTHRSDQPAAKMWQEQVRSKLHDPRICGPLYESLAAQEEWKALESIQDTGREESECASKPGLALVDANEHYWVGICRSTISGEVSGPQTL